MNDYKFRDDDYASSNLEEEIGELKGFIEELSLYFKSGNNVPVERAQIYTKDFESLKKKYSIDV